MEFSNVVVTHVLKYASETWMMSEKNKIFKRDLRAVDSVLPYCTARFGFDSRRGKKICIYSSAIINNI